MRSLLARHWKILAPLGAVAAAVVAYLAISVFGVHTLFVDDRVDEDDPVFADGADEAPITLASGSFVDRSHPAEGVASVLTDGTDERFLRFEDFATDNGPDLNVYLSAAPPDAPAGDFDDEFVDLGDLKGNIGNQNYEIPADVDLDRYRSVVIWCVRFGVAFGAAELS
jgi:hypothetical protein